MESKKDLILKAAMNLFTEKGYRDTSIQEIAESCGISKGAFYLYFRSKDELLLAIMQHFEEEVQKKLLEIKNQKDLSPRDRLLEQIFFQFNDLAAYQGFFDIQLRESAFPVDDRLEYFLTKCRYDWQKLQEENLLELYGAALRPYLIDAAAILNGLLNEYTTLMLFERIHMDFKKLANFLVTVMDSVAGGLVDRGGEPFLTPEMMPNRQMMEQEATRSALNEVRQVLAGMNELAAKLKLSPGNRREVDATLEVLDGELVKEDPNKLIVQGMLANLRDIDELTEFRTRIALQMKIKLL